MSETTAVPIAPTKRSWLVWLVGAIAVAALFGIVMAWTGTAKAVAESGSAEQFLAWHKGRPGIVTTASGLQYQVMKKGEGATPTDSDVAVACATARFLIRRSVRRFLLQVWCPVSPKRSS